MDRDEFNRDMDGYIAVRKGKPRAGAGIFYFFKKSSTNTTRPTRSAEPDRQPGSEARKTQEKELETMEAKLDEVNEIEDAVEEKREGILKGFFRKLHLYNKQDAPEEEDASEPEEQSPMQDDEVKRILKLTYGWLNDLPEEKIVAFKDSEDFEVYKRVLGQYGLIKNKRAASDEGESESAPAKESAKSSPDSEEDDA